MTVHKISCELAAYSSTLHGLYVRAYRFILCWLRMVYMSAYLRNQVVLPHASKMQLAYAAALVLRVVTDAFCSSMFSPLRVTFCLFFQLKKKLIPRSLQILFN